MPVTRPIPNSGSSRLVPPDADCAADQPQARSSSPIPSTQETPLLQDRSVLVPSAVITVLTAKPSSQADRSLFRLPGLLSTCGHRASADRICSLVSDAKLFANRSALF